ncbi:conserved repeat domain-containing protein [Curtobacterium sp. 314Chir4.1]|uniref:DUF5979 domain-containing protein n=1 Tax=Curtobacterium sp. 314Chir4.1 TaxID=1279028 RepID=UPI000BD25377|nr:DUF5979 domain-containing protein [Curtobacterium sp. 314Chir4.1]SOC86909.1 conserved repeat domain-containing protein [Curtobacterium sp. 314Chir4.1]
MGWNHPLRAAIAASTVVLLALGAVTTAALPAAAADPAALEVNKLVNGGKAATVGPGDEFTFTIRLGCDDADCVNARIDDSLPAELAGFPIVSFSATPPNPAPPAAPDWVVSHSGCGGTPPVEVTTAPPCVGSVQFVQPLADGTTGLAAGQAYTLTLTLRVPDDLPPTWAYNGTPITNTGTGTADNAATAASTATITVNIPTTIDANTTKSWTPATERYSPGAASVVTLTTENTSNVPATSIVIQEPADATDGADALSPTNPFRYVDITGPGNITLPAGATAVQIDAYVLDPATGTYHWVTGAPGPPDNAALPAGVGADSVAGIRLTYTGDDGAVLTPGDPAASVRFDVTQRATDRDTGAGIDGGWTTTNTASGTVTVPGHDPATDSASADHTVTPTALAATATKTITPGRIPAGGSATGTITATNASDGPVQELTISDLDYFTAEISFGGFTAPLTYPASATGATVTWHFSDETTRTDSFDNGDTPVASPPADTYVTGFEIAYEGPVDAGASTTTPFTIDTAPDAAATETLRTTNTADVTVVNGDASASDDANAPLDVFTPDIDIALSKTLSPQEPIAPGGTVVAELPATTSTDSAFVTPTTITIEDVAPSPHEDSSFWNAFDPVAIAPTQVPAGATLTIQYTSDDGDTWQQLPIDGLPATGPTTFSGTIPTDLQGDITGLRFVFTNPDGFPQGTTVQPNFVSQARADQRYGGDPTSTPDGDPTPYTNHATAQGEGTVDGGGTIDSDVAEADAGTSIESTSGDGSLIAGKRWTDTDFTTDRTTVDSQSGEQVGSTLEWGARTTGTSTMTVTDPAGNADDPAATTFQAFNLQAIAPVPVTTDRLWQWDDVASIELFSGGTWSTVPAPAAGWVDDSGFVGYTLTAAQSAATTGVRITITPDDAARAASTDPTRPVPGSGIATSTTPRAFNLVWALRNTLRDPQNAGDRWVNGTTDYNLTAAGSIRNTVNVDAATTDGPRDATAHDDLVILDRPPLVSVAKTSEHDVLSVPVPGDVDPSAYPTNDMTVSARNGSASRASYVRVTDPMPCSPSTLADCTSAADDWAADPYTDAIYTTTNPFERFTLTGLDFTFDASEVDADASIVSLLHRDGDGTLTTSTTTITGARAASTADLADVVGVSVVYQGADPATTGGTISSDDALVMTMHTQLRATLRSLPSVPVTATTTVTNRAFAQSYDPVLAPSGQTSTPTDSTSADVRLVRGVLDVNAGKTFTPNTVLEANRASTIDVALTAKQGPDATVAPDTVTIEDSDTDFWNAVRLESFSPDDVTLPAGADQVRVDVRTNGTASWQTGTPSTTATLPTSNLAAITGIRFVFTRADGDVLSHTTPPAAWTAAATLHVRILETERDGNAVRFPSTIGDTTTVTSHRAEDTLFPDATSTADDTLTLDPGTRSLDIVKAPADNQHTVPVGSTVPWTITMHNTGTGIITLTSVDDQLPAALTWDGTDPTYTTSDGGTLSTDVTLAQDDDGTLTFTWPTTGNRMAPDETFTVVIPLTLQPGLQENERATNAVTATTTTALDACTNTSGNGQGTIPELPANQCGTTNYVQPTPGPALQTSKAVRGDIINSLVSGAVNPTDPGSTCTPDGEGFTLPPCVAETRVGGTDEWRLTARNTGTVNQDTVTFVDALPTPGDILLATGSSRGSTYRPAFDGPFGVSVNAPDGATTTWQVTTDAAVCADGSGSTWTSDTTCAANTWTDGDTFAGDWGAVTGVRIIVDVSPAGGVAPGGTVTARYRTVNVPAGAARPDAAPVSVPAGGDVAYNQVGTTATLTNGALPLAQAPVKVGVILTAGSLLVQKEITGAGAAAAPDRFTANVSCVVAGAPVDLGDSAELVLDRADMLQARVDGIPLGAQCTVTEDGDDGSYGEAVRTITPGTVTILTPTGAGEAVPELQVVTITNSYNLTPTPPTPTPTPPGPTPAPAPGQNGSDGGSADASGPRPVGLAFTGADGGAALSLLILAALLCTSGLLIRRTVRRRR